VSEALPRLDVGSTSDKTATSEGVPGHAGMTDVVVGYTSGLIEGGSESSVSSDPSVSRELLDVSHNDMSKYEEPAA